MILDLSVKRAERWLPEPDRFDVTRQKLDDHRFGTEVHLREGMHLAQLEMKGLLRAVVERVGRINVGKPL